jgi:hypothetical protein
VPRLWNGVDLDKQVPELGMRLDMAALIPDFLAQFLDSGLCADTQHLLLAPLDDLKEWLRSQPPGEQGLKHDIRKLLLEQEELDRARAEKAGQRFDLVDYELIQMSTDSSYEMFDVDWAKNIFALVLEEAEALQAFAAADFRQNFSQSLSFHLPDPRRHPIFKIEEIEAALKRFGADEKLCNRVLKGPKRPECSGALILELYKRGTERPDLPKAGPTCLVQVGLADARAGDWVDAALHIAYPRDLEGYFLMTLDALRKQLILKEEP